VPTNESAGILKDFRSVTTREFRDDPESVIESLLCDRQPVEIHVDGGRSVGVIFPVTDSNSVMISPFFGVPEPQEVSADQAST
jgi:hypothetical protein